MIEQLSEKDFLKRLKEQFRISRLDKDKPNSAARFAREGHYIRARYVHLPIRRGVFNALFYQDNHSSLDDNVQMIGTVRGGYCYL